jgi:hypothetical protein
MVGSMYFPSVTKLSLAQPPMYLTTWSGAPIQLAAEAAPLRRLCDVHLNPLRVVAPTAVHASRSEAESVVAACQSLEFS